MLDQRELAYIWFEDKGFLITLFDIRRLTNLFGNRPSAVISYLLWIFVVSVWDLQQSRGMIGCDTDVLVTNTDVRGPDKVSQEC